MIYAGLPQVDVGSTSFWTLQRLIIKQVKLDEALLRLLASFVYNIRSLTFVGNEKKLGFREYDSDMFISTNVEVKTLF